MKHGPIHIATVLILLLTACLANAQVNIKTTVNRNNILIGERISLTVEAYVPLGEKIGWFRSDSIEHFDILERSPTDTIENMDGKKIAQILTITSFDSGRWQIPAFEVIVGGQPYYSDSITIDVAFSAFDPRDDYHDIKDILETADAKLDYIPWIVGAVAVISLALIILMLSKRKPAAVTVKKEYVSPLSPYEEAVTSLVSLKNRGVKEGQEKIYYSEMNDILRRYVSRKFGISTFERTNEELIIQLSDINIPKDAFIRLTQSLRMSDFVKFAKYRPSEEENASNLDIVRASIDLLNNTFAGAV